MRIYLPDLKAKYGEAVDFSFDEKLEDYFDDFSEGGDLKLRLGALMNGDEIFIHGTLEAAVTAECSRCLASFNHVFRTDFNEVFTVTGEAPAESDPQNLAAEAANLLTVTGDFLHLDEYIRQLIILAQAYKPLCRSDCKGICAECGKDLNSTTCRCSEENEPVDVRLQKLKDFKAGS